MRPGVDIRDHVPSLHRAVHPSGVGAWTDPVLSDRGIIVAFSERSGGASEPPYDSLNLAAHVGDSAEAVDANRASLLAALGVRHLRSALVTAEQVHGERIAVITSADAGAGSRSTAAAPIGATDALLTQVSGVPLLMCYADCVPVILVAPGISRGVCVVHAGWRGALAGLPGSAARELAARCACDPSEMLVYVGPHIGRCCYEVGEGILSQFCNTFDTIGAVDGRLDLGAAVRESLTRNGVSTQRITEIGLCTRDHTDRFFSYRADPVTGRHGALAVIAEGE